LIEFNVSIRNAKYLSNLDIHKKQSTVKKKKKKREKQKEEKTNVYK